MIDAAIRTGAEAIASAPRQNTMTRTTTHQLNIIIERKGDVGEEKIKGRGRARSVPSPYYPAFSLSLLSFMGILDYWRCLILVPVLLLQIWVNDILTVRTIQWLTPLVASPVRGAWTYPLPSRTDGNVTHIPWILRDLGYESIPAPSNWDQVAQAEAFINATPFIFVGLALLACLWARNPIRVVEYIGALITLTLLNTGAHVWTTMPSSSGIEAPCLDASHASAGAWEWTTYNLSACGDQMFSNHMMHTLTAKLILMRTIWYGGGASPPLKPPYKSISTTEEGGEAAISVSRFDRWTIYVAIDLFTHAWLLALALVMIYARFHYTTDIWISVALTWLVGTHTRLLQGWVHLLYPFRNHRVEQQKTVGGGPWW